jgi:uncharacterized membrane protein
MRTTQADNHMDELMGLLLRSGVILAACIVLVGGVVYLARHPYPIDYRVFRGEPEGLSAISGIFSEATKFHGRGLMQLGLLVLIFTPTARVTFSVFAFLYQRDWKYVVFTLIVLGILLYSLLRRG